jgi:tryptophan synthase alpha chain
MNRIEKLFSSNKKNILSIYFTAGYPQLNDTVTIIKELDKAGVDLIEIGMPFSDPVADGPVIQRSSEVALRNGMSLNLLFTQLKKIREITDIPLILMGYVNPFFKYGFDRLLQKCAETGIDGTIIPDLPVDEYLSSYASLYNEKNIYNIFLVSPQTSPERIKYLDSISKGFLYIVSTSSTTGAVGDANHLDTGYLKKLVDLELERPGLIGFGINDRASFDQACEWADGAIIGSAFIKALDEDGSISGNIERFIRTVR